MEKFKTSPFFLFLFHIKSFPKVARRKRGCQTDFFFGYRVYKLYLSGMETDASVGIGTW
jgi:hypothetical protein